MTYEFIQAALTNLISFTVIAGFGGCLAHYLWTSHTTWMATYCPPVAPYSPELLPDETEIIVPTLLPLETSLPQLQICEWASPIACLLEDCPESSLTGQSYELFCQLPELLSVELPTNEAIALWAVPEAIAYTQDAVTIGCNNQSRLKSWGEWLYRQDWGLTRQQCYQGRKSKRMIGFKYELELPALLREQLEVLFKQDFTKQPVMPPDHPIPAPKHQPKIQRGDKVVLTLTPSETFEATTEVANDNRFFAKSLLDGRRELLSFDAVTIVERAA